MDRDLKDLLAHTITVQPFSTQDKYGEPSYGTAVNYKGLVQQKVRMVRNLQGEQVVSTTTVHVDTTTAISPRDKLTLPSGFVPQAPPIINVHRMSDERGLDHTVIYL